MNLTQRLLSPFKKEVETPVIPNTEDLAYAEPSAIYTSNDFTKWNPDNVVGRKGLQVYGQMMKDEQVKAAVRFKRDAITSRSYAFRLDSAVSGLTPEQSAERIALFEEIIKQSQGSWIDTLNRIMSAMTLGYSINEKIHKQIDYQGKAWWGLNSIKLRPADTFWFDVDKYGNTCALRQKCAGIDLVLDPADFIHYVCNPDIDEHYGRSELQAAYRSFFSKDIILKYRNIYLERFAGGYRWAKLGTDSAVTTGSQDYTALQDILRNLVSGSGVIMPKGTELVTEDPASTNAFKQALDDLDLSIARALLVPPLLGVSPQGNTGSYSQGNIQLEAFFWTLASENTRLEETLNNQLFKPLGDLNWGDGKYPLYQHKPLSNTQIAQLLETWGSMAEKGIVNPSDLDENYIRDMLDMPARLVEDDAASITPATNALNGAQVTSLVDVLERVANGSLDKAAAAKTIALAYPLSTDDAEDLLSTIVVKEVTPVQAPETSEPEETEEPNSSDEGLPDETVRGMGLVNVRAFKKAEGRCDFAVIDKDSTDITEGYTEQVSAVGAEIIADLIVKMRAEGELTENISDNILALKVDPKLKKQLNKTVSAMLTDGAVLGERHAESELDKAKGESFSMSIDRKRLQFIADDYFATKAFTIAGQLADDYVKSIQNTITTGAAQGATLDQVEREIYNNLAAKGLIAKDDLRQALGEALGTENPDARLRTIVRTNTFDSINQARHSYFTDPVLGGFVVAYEYSAILDSRTTEICRHLDGDNRGDHSIEWYASNAGYRPPNHFNCRSLLIPVTELDTDFVEGEQPDLTPAQGFGG